MSRWWIFCLVLLTPALTRGDTITLRNGQTRQGRIVARDAEEIRFELEQDGIKAVVSIPRAQILRLEETLLLPATSSAPATSPSLADATTTAAPVPHTPRESRFLRELAASAVGQGSDNPDRLSPDLRQLWQNVLDAESSGKLDHLLLSMKTLADAMPLEPDRLDAIALRIKGKSFGAWMAQTRWQLMANRYKGGVFELKDIAAIERPHLVDILRAQTAPAVEPLRQFFPPTPVPGQPYPRNNPLLGVNTSNALVVKDRGLFAAAVLYAQLKLDPALPRLEKETLTMQLAYVRRCVARANEFEPAARAILQREERTRREAEERARRQSLLHSAGPRP